HDGCARCRRQMQWACVPADEKGGTTHQGNELYQRGAKANRPPHIRALEDPLEHRLLLHRSRQKKVPREFWFEAPEELSVVFRRPTLCRPPCARIYNNESPGPQRSQLILYIPVALV